MQKNYRKNLNKKFKKLYTNKNWNLKNNQQHNIVSFKNDFTTFVKGMRNFNCKSG